MDLTIKNLELITNKETFSVIEKLLDELIDQKRNFLKNVLLTEHHRAEILSEINSLSEFRTFPGKKLDEMRKQGELNYER